MAEYLCCFFPQHVVACFPDNTASLGEKERKAWNSNKYQSSTAILIPFFYITPCCPLCIGEDLCKKQKGCSAVMLKFFPAVMPRKRLLKLDDQ